MKKLLCFVLNLLYPLRCSFCGIIITQSQYFLCNNCLNNIKFIDNGCEKCGKALMIGYNSLCSNCRSTKYYFDRAYSVVQYKNQIKKEIIKYKFFRKKELEKTFVELLISKIQNIDEIDLILGVPLHEERVKQRGFNQAENLAKKIAQRMKIDFDNTCFKRVKNTKSQTVLPKSQRLKNLKNAFKVIKKERIKYKTILLVDDIYTTGSTVSECSKSLKMAEADKVFVLTLASGEGY